MRIREYLLGLQVSMRNVVLYINAFRSVRQWCAAIVLLLQLCVEWVASITAMEDEVSAPSLSISNRLLP